jgi:hypothetical protein
MLMRVQRNVQETVEATAESTLTAPVGIAQSTTTTPLATATTPLTTAESMVTTVSTIDSFKRPPTVKPIIDNLIKLHTSAGEPIEVSALALCSASGVMYNNFDVLTNCQFTIQQEKRVTDENDPSIAKDHIVRQPCFRFWIAKGAAQFTTQFSKHPEFDPEITFQSFLIDQFYFEIFPSEKDELYKLLTDEDMSHLVLFGRKHNESKCEASASFWKIIAAASFLPTKDQQTI